jgi:hypothetical protein
VTPTDELWIDMAQFDTEIADGLWDGLLPADAPAWCSDVASLIGTARGPATEDELAAEDLIVARMAEAILEAAAEAEAEAAAGAEAEAEAAAGAEAQAAEADVEDDDSPAADEPGGAEPRPRLSVVPPVMAAGPDDEPTAEEAEADGTVEPAAAAPEPSALPEGDGHDRPRPVPDEAGDPAEVAATVGEPGELPAGDGAAPGEPGDARDELVAARAAYPLHLKQRQYVNDGRFRLVRRVVAVKAAATTTAIAIGITAAAAATGVVVSVVDPPRWPGEVKETSTSSTSPGATVTIDLSAPPSGEALDERSATSPTKQLTCVLNLGCADPEAVLGPQAINVPALAERVEALAQQASASTTTLAGAGSTGTSSATTAPPASSSVTTASPDTTVAPTTTIAEPTTTTTEATTTTTAAPPTSDTVAGPGTLSASVP